jgi:hypothetical protein
MTLAVPGLMTSASAYSGGFLDDGLYDDNWFFDYYEASPDAGTNQTPDKLREYDASQMYEEAEESGLFNF